jgi:hypothetical protein
MAGLGRGIVVLGMHRSGTSAITRVIDALGLPACRAEDRMPYELFESMSVGLYNERLLNRLGGFWFAPPALPRGWPKSSVLAGAADEAALIFSAAHPFAQWVWKDPRACILMPFWDLVLGAGMPRVIVLRNPLESAASLFVRNRIPAKLALALAERSLRSAFTGSAGRRVLVTAYDELFVDLDGWCERLEAFARASGLSLPAPLPLEAARACIDPELRHHAKPEPGPGSGVSASLRRLWSWANGRRGAHESLSIAGLPRESTQSAVIFRDAVKMVPQPFASRDG